MKIIFVGVVVLMPNFAYCLNFNETIASNEISIGYGCLLKCMANCLAISDVRKKNRFS